jgi:hypothetical protein
VADAPWDDKQLLAQVGRKPERHNPSSIATLRIALARQLLEFTSLSLSRGQSVWLIFGINIYFCYTSLRAGMIGCCMPSLVK